MKNKDSVAKGSSSVVVSRLLGMSLSFALFIILARHSDVEAGIFRTVVTYFVIAEFLGMLGMHRWLSTEIAPDDARRWPIFFSMTTITVAVSTLLALIYAAVAFSGFYDADLSLGLKLAALAVIPSGIFQCVQSALVGIGKSHMLGMYNLSEYLVRCSISIVLIYFDYSVITVIIVFVVTRWVVAIYGLKVLCRLLEAGSWVLDKADLKHVLKDAPRFMLIIVAFLLLRNVAIIVLPAFSGESETAVYAVAYQLFDLILIIPSVLALTSNNLFVNKAQHSLPALRRATTQLSYLTSGLLFPCIAVVIIFAYNLILFLYGDQYMGSSPVLVLLMLASGVAMVDQVLSQVMMSRKDYNNDMISICVGGFTGLGLTLALVPFQGAYGAALAILLAFLLTVVARIWILRDVFPYKLLVMSSWRALLASSITCLLFLGILKIPFLEFVSDSKFLWIVLAPFALLLYAGLMYGLGGLSSAKLARTKQFLFNS